MQNPDPNISKEEVLAYFEKHAIPATVQLQILLKCPTCQSYHSFIVPTTKDDFGASPMTDERKREVLELDVWQELPKEADDLFEIGIPQYMTCHRCGAMIKHVYPPALQRMGFQLADDEKKGFEDYTQEDDDF